MTKEQYDELIAELNFYDDSVGIPPIVLSNREVIESILIDFNYTPIGYHDTKNTESFKFKDSEGNMYSIQEKGDGLEVYRLIEL